MATNTLSLTPERLATILHRQFPIDTVCWSVATDEVRDLSRHARECLNLGEEHAVDFRLLTTPSQWNSKGLEAIIRWYTLMDEDTRGMFINNHYEWFYEWNED